ncbi:hypothetical protein K3629_000463 [Escherichia coli]|nr:hypothetical protein [Escherichia coli]EHX9031414.1 hypothetical protein [Escherichia coli]EJB4647095.1 hypothetical protein [Escherichia coli]HBE5311223.1 hypothetical protein [Escherichia coli]HCO5653520.1 hypothetical protein [Escherichia coli]
MSVMIFQAGGDTKIWGRKLKTKTVDPDDVAVHLANGWYKHPDDVPDDPLVGDQIGSVGGGETSPVDMGEVSDGYHTFNELYAHRVRLFSSLMHAYADLSWWSRKHSDGEEWDGWIIAGITTPEGEITYHLPVEEIEFLPEGTELEFGKEWDGHEANDVLGRLLSLRPAIAEPEEKQRKKPGRKPKAAADEPDNEG